MNQKIRIIQPETDLLFIMHFQNDLVMPTGNIPVPDGEQIIEPIKKIFLLFDKIALCLLKMPLHYPGFSPTRYCVFGSWGADYPYLERTLEQRVLMIKHGFNLQMSINSYFSDPNFLMELKNWGCRRVFFCGVTLETDIKEMALILKNQNLEVIIFEDCVKPRDADAGKAAKQDLEMAGIQFMKTSQFFG